MREAARVLIVDDDEDVRDVITATLNGHGWDLVAVPSAHAALDALADAPVALVITDLSMPEMSGVELVRAMVAQGVTTPVLVISGRTDLIAQLPALEPVRGVVGKPFNVRDLRARVRAVLEGGG